MEADSLFSEPPGKPYSHLSGYEITSHGGFDWIFLNGLECLSFFPCVCWLFAYLLLESNVSLSLLHIFSVG